MYWILADTKGSSARERLSLGAGLRITVEDEQGDRIPARYDLLDEQWNEKPLRMRVWAKGASYDTSWYVLTNGVNQATPPLPSGRYTLVLTLDGYEEERIPLALTAGEMYVVPRGVEHKPRAEHECHVLVVEPRGVVNTGEAGGPQTADNDVWI